MTNGELTKKSIIEENMAAPSFKKPFPHSPRSDRLLDTT